MPACKTRFARIFHFYIAPSSHLHLDNATISLQINHVLSYHSEGRKKFFSGWNDLLRADVETFIAVVLIRSEFNGVDILGGQQRSVALRRV